MHTESPARPSASPPPALVRSVTSGPILARNTLINIVGQVAPLPVAILTLPRIIEGMGPDRFGILSLAWVVVGYVSLLDFGLGRALTALVAQKIGAGRDQEVPRLVWTAALPVGLLGILGAAVMALLAPWIVDHLLTLPTGLRREAVGAFYWLALGIPSVVVTSALMGIITALQRFDIINGVRIPLALFVYLTPLLVLPFTRDLSVIVAVLVLGRTLACGVYGLYVMRLLPALGHGVVRDPALMRPLLRFGGWMTVSNIVGPMMVYLDRFLIGALVSVASVAYYAVPFDLATKVLIVPLALVGVLFPAFTTTFAQERERTLYIYDRSLRYTFFVLFPVVLVMVAFAAEGLTIWLGGPFALRSALVLQLLGIGVLLNSLAQSPFALIQGIGRPDLTAKMHVIELPLYLLAIWWALGRYGINGAALVWTLRVFVDLVALCVVAQQLSPEAAAVHRRAASYVTPGVAAIAVFLVALTPAVKILSVLTLFVAFGVLGWFSVLRHERALVARWLKGRAL